jgi:hypothetical protein
MRLVQVSQNREMRLGQSEKQEPVHQEKPECKPISWKALWTYKKFPFACPMP